MNFLKPNTLYTKMIKNFSVVIFGKEYHKELYHYIKLMSKNESIEKGATGSFFNVKIGFV